MRVNKINQTSKTSEFNKVSAKTTVEGSHFTQLMDEKRDEKRRDELNRLMDKIKEKGSELVDSKNVELLVNYKKMIKEFVSNAVEFAFEIQERKGFSRMGRTKILKIVSLIDESLVEITNGFLEQERNKINMLSKIGELNGLLMNIFV